MRKNNNHGTRRRGADLLFTAIIQFTWMGIEIVEIKEMVPVNLSEKLIMNKINN